MAVYDNVPDIKKAPTKRQQRTQKPASAASEAKDFAESATTKRAKPTKATGKPVSNQLDTTNKAAKVAGKGTTRDSIAQGAQKPSTRSPKPGGNSKKVRGETKK